MKKMFFFAVALLTAATMNAQHVSKLDSLSVQFQLDSMRVKYVNNPTGMLVELNAISAALESDAKMLKEAGKQLKEETSYAKSLDKYTKSALKALDGIEKGYTAEGKGLEQLRSAVESELAAIRKLNMVTDEHKEQLEKDLNDQASPIAEAIKNVNANLKDIAGQKQNLVNQQNNLNIYNQEIKDKTAALKELETQYKANKDAVKKEIPACKAAIKAQK